MEATAAIPLFRSEFLGSLFGLLLGVIVDLTEGLLLNFSFIYVREDVIASLQPCLNFPLILLGQKQQRFAAFRFELNVTMC